MSLFGDSFSVFLEKMPFIKEIDLKKMSPTRIKKFFEMISPV